MNRRPQSTPLKAGQARREAARGARFRALFTVFCLSVLCFPCSVLCAPAWWFLRGAVDTNPAADHAAVNAGQVKWFATNAYDELQAHLPEGAGPGVAAVISGFSGAHNYVAINIGQLKFVGKPFHDRLIAAGCATHYPWTETTADDADHAMATLGQLKTVFDFELPLDADGDGMLDAWELRYFGNLDPTGAEDPDHDGLNDLLEYQGGTIPNDWDSDGDGLPDGWEAEHGLNPQADDASGDTDHDGISNIEEFRSRALAVAVILGEPGWQGDDDSWDLTINGHPAASSRNGSTGTGTVYLPYGSRAEFALQRVETGQGGDATDEYALRFEPVGDPAGPIPWLAAGENSPLEGVLPYPVDTSGLRWEYVVPELAGIEVTEGGSGSSESGPGQSPLDRATVRAGARVSLKALLSPAPPVEPASGEPGFITWTVVESPEEDTDSDGLCDPVDLAPATGSDDFSDAALGGSTRGRITARADRVFQVFDAEDPGDGVRIIVSGGALPATIETVGGVPEATITIPAGTNADFILSSGSVRLQVLQGGLELGVQGVATVITAALVKGGMISVEQTDAQTLEIASLDRATSTVEISVNGALPAPLLPGWSVLLEITFDGDGDGVLDGVDEYPNSDARPTVIIDGADTGVRNTVFPDGWTISDQIAACAVGVKNHGEFVSRVTRLANDLKQQGVMTDKDAAAIVKAAAGSGIGKK